MLGVFVLGIGYHRKDGVVDRCGFVSVKVDLWGRWHCQLSTQVSTVACARVLQVHFGAKVGFVTLLYRPARWDPASPSVRILQPTPSTPGNPELFGTSKLSSRKSSCTQAEGSTVAAMCIPWSRPTFCSIGVMLAAISSYTVCTSSKGEDKIGLIEATTGSNRCACWPDFTSKRRGPC